MLSHQLTPKVPPYMLKCLQAGGALKKKIYLKTTSLNTLGACCADCRWIATPTEMKHVWALLKEKQILIHSVTVPPIIFSMAHLFFYLTTFFFPARC